MSNARNLSKLKPNTSGLIESDDLTSALTIDTLTGTNDATINGVKVGRGAGAVGTNTAVGISGPLAVNTSGGDNTALGNAALGSNITGNANTATGSAALILNTSGSNNTAVGRSALLYNTTASSNTAVGYQAGYSNTTGTAIVAIGENALPANTTGNDNTAVGRRAGQFNTTGSQNTMLGTQAMALNTTGNYNTSVGASALQSNTTASYNTAVGYQAAYGTTTGAYNASFGQAAFNSNSTGNFNTALGTQSLASNTTANNNTAVGYQAGYANTTGVGNLFVGRNAGRNSTGSGNCFVGYYAGNASTGNQNTFIGSGLEGSVYSSGELMTTGSKNTILGNFSGNQGGLDIRTANNYIVLSDGDGNPRIICNGSGDVAIGETGFGGVKFNVKTTTTANYAGYFTFVSGGYGIGVRNSSGGAADLMYFFSPNYVGGISTSGSTTSFNTASDYRLKENIAPMTGALATVAQLKPVTYTWKADGANGHGFIAHELQAVVPECVVGEKDAVDSNGNPKYQGIDTSFLVATLTAAIQELKAEFDAYKASHP